MRPGAPAVNSTSTWVPGRGRSAPGSVPATIAWLRRVRPLGRRWLPVCCRASVSRSQRRPAGPARSSPQRGHTQVAERPAPGPECRRGMTTDSAPRCDDPDPARPAALTAGAADTCRALSSTCFGRRIMNVEITGLTRRFGRTTAVAGVDLQAGPGVFGLLGPNGAGKTSLLRMMATAVPPTSGRLRLLGRDPGCYGPRREIRRRLGYLPQALGYYPGFTVGEFVEYFALLKEVPAAQIPAAVAVAIQRVDLGGRAKAKLRTLSGGMLRRVGVAQAIVNEPELLLLDEPTAGLDPEQRVAFRALLRELGQHAT